MRFFARTVLLAMVCLSGCKPSATIPKVASEASASDPVAAVNPQSSAEEPLSIHAGTARLSAATAEAGCATCIFHMKGVSGCKLAVKIDGHAYLVEGSGIDDHGDAHADDGLCNAARKARVSGQVKSDKFVASKIELLP